MNCEIIANLTNGIEEYAGNCWHDIVEVDGIYFLRGLRENLHESQLRQDCGKKSKAASPMGHCPWLDQGE